MVSTRKKGQSSRRLLSQLDDFDRNVVIGNAAGGTQENIVVNEGTNDRDLTVGTSGNNTVGIESTMNVKTLKKNFNERVDREMSNFVDTVEDRIQKAILTAIDNNIAPKIELAIRSINASSGRDVTSETANSERGENVRISASFENASENNNLLHVSNVNDENRRDFPDEVSELSVPGTRVDRQPHTHHSCLAVVFFVLFHHESLLVFQRPGWFFSQPNRFLQNHQGYLKFLTSSMRNCQKFQRELLSVTFEWKIYSTM